MPKKAADADKAVAILTEVARSDKSTWRSLHNEDGSVKKLSEVVHSYWEQLRKAKSDEQRAEWERLSDRPCIEGDVRFCVGEEVSGGQRSEQRVIGEALVEMIKESGIEVEFVSQEEGQRVAAMSAAVEMQAVRNGMSMLEKAAKFISDGLKKNTRGRIFKITLPTSTIQKIRKAMGRDFESHNITINGIVHALRNHGESGLKLSNISIPLTKEDVTLAPYIMTAPDKVEKGTTDITGRESVRFYKNLSNGYVVVVEKEYKNNPDDMETITMWAEMSPAATNAQRKVAHDTHVRNAILSTDAAKIRKDAENAIAEDVKNSEFMQVWHGSPHFFEAFDHSHMGEGEGAQIHGWGTYVTVSKAVGTNYALMDAPYVRAQYVGNKKVPEGVNTFQLGGLFVKRSKNEVVAYIKDIIRKRRNSNQSVDEYKKDLAFIKSTSDEDWIFDNKGQSNLYAVEIPDDTGSNYLDENKIYKPKEIREIATRIQNPEGSIDILYMVKDLMHPSIEKMTGRELYFLIAEDIGVEQDPDFEEASKALASAGFVGIKYRGMQDGECYVIFNEKDAKITSHVQFLRTPNGIVFGWTENGRIHLTPEGINPNTPIHEYTHLWDKVLQRANPKLWERGKALMMECPVWGEVVNDPAYADIANNEDAIASEVHSRLSGKEGERILADMAAVKKGDTVFDAAKKASLVEQIKAWLRDALKFVRDAVGKWTDADLKNLTLDEFAKMPIKDLANKRSEVREQRTESGAARFSLEDVWIADKQEYARLASVINSYGMKDVKKGMFYEAFTVDNYYIYTANKYGDFRVKLAMPIVGNEEQIGKLHDSIKNGTNRITKALVDFIEDCRNERNANNYNNATLRRRRGGDEDLASMVIRQSTNTRTGDERMVAELFEGTPGETGHAEVSPATEREEITDLSEDNARFSLPPTRVENAEGKGGEEYREAYAADLYESRMANGMVQFREAMQDSMASLSEAMKAILRAEGKSGAARRMEEIPIAENAYLGENALSSINQAEAEAVARLKFAPLMEALAKLAPKKADYQGLLDYMMAKHGLERQLYMEAKEGKHQDYAGLTGF